MPISIKPRSNDQRALAALYRKSLKQAKYVRYVHRSYGARLDDLANRIEAMEATGVELHNEDMQALSAEYGLVDAVRLPDLLDEAPLTDEQTSR